jgi:hypothetical protein
MISNAESARRQDRCCGTPELKYDAAGDRLTEYYAGTYHLPYNTLYGGVNPTVTTV